MNHFKLMVCPHDTAKNTENWFNFSQYLSQTVSSSFLFQKSIDFPDFHDNLMSGGLIYANPQDSLKLIREHAYIPVTRPSNLSDEIVFIAANSLEAAKIDDLSGKQLSSVESMMVTNVGLKSLSDLDIRPSGIDSKASWMAVVKSIFRNEADYAMVYKDFYEGLNRLSKSGLQKIAETYDGSIHHNFLISEELADSAEKIRQCLTQMHENEKGKALLKALKMEKLVTVSREEILKFEALDSYKLDSHKPESALA